MAGILRVATNVASSVPRRIALATASSGSCDGCCSKREFSALLTPLEEFPGYVVFVIVSLVVVVVVAVAV